MPDEEWDRTFRVNVYAYFWLVKAALPHLKPGASTASGSQTGIAVADAARSRHPRELRGTGSGVDAAQRRRRGPLAYAFLASDADSSYTLLRETRICKLPDVNGSTATGRRDELGGRRLGVAPARDPRVPFVRVDG